MHRFSKGCGLQALRFRVLSGFHAGYVIQGLRFGIRGWGLDSKLAQDKNSKVFLQGCRNQTPNKNQAPVSNDGGFRPAHSRRSRCRQRTARTSMPMTNTATSTRKQNASGKPKTEPSHQPSQIRETLGH